jgi:hypothetical protein
MPVLFALGWAATTVIGIDVDEQFTVFGAMGAIVFTLLSGLLLSAVSADDGVDLVRGPSSLAGECGASGEGT